MGTRILEEKDERRRIMEYVIPILYSLSITVSLMVSMGMIVGSIYLIREYKRRSNGRQSPSKRRHIS